MLKYKNSNQNNYPNIKHLSHQKLKMVKSTLHEIVTQLYQIIA